MSARPIATQTAPWSRSRPAYGGQAVLEGVMLRGRRYMAVAVRAPDDQIVVRSEALPWHLYGGVIQKIPFVRGVTVLWDSLGLGMKALLFSADVRAQGLAAERGEPTEELTLSKPLQVTTVVLAVVFGVGVFFLVPLGLVGAAEHALGTIGSIWSNVLEGLIRLTLLVGYVGLIGLMPEMRRVYEYHGAEHMTIHAWEHDDPLDADHVGRYPPAHPRCGTAFLLEVVAISVLLFALLGTPALWLRLLSRIVLIPVIAGIAYELLRLGGRYPNSRVIRLIVAPGLALQALTTRYPERPQMEVAIASMEELLRREGAPSDP